MFDIILKIDSKSLSFYRIIFGFFLLISNSIYRFNDFVKIPSQFKKYPSIADFFDGFGSLLIHDIVTLVSFISIYLFLVGYKVKISALIIFSTFIFNYSFLFSIGGASSLFLIPFSTVVLGFTSCNSYYSIDAVLKKVNSKKYDALILSLLLVTISFSFFISAFMKVKGGWLNVNSQAVFMLWGYNEIIDLREPLININNFHVSSKIFWEISDYIIILVEAAPFLFIWHKNLLKISLFSLGFFHIIVYLSLNISFSMFPLMYALFFLDNKDSKILRCFHFILNKVFREANIKKVIVLTILSFPIYLIFYFLFRDSLSYNNIAFGYLIGLMLSFLFLLTLALESFYTFIRLKVNNPLFLKNLH